MTHGGWKDRRRNLLLVQNKPDRYFSQTRLPSLLSCSVEFDVENAWHKTRIKNRIDSDFWIIVIRITDSSYVIVIFTDRAICNFFNPVNIKAFIQVLNTFSRHHESAVCMLMTRRKIVRFLRSSKSHVENSKKVPPAKLQSWLSRKNVRDLFEDTKQ